MDYALWLLHVLPARERARRSEAAPPLTPVPAQPAVVR
jgi:hypothetical protein